MPIWSSDEDNNDEDEQNYLHWGPSVVQSFTEKERQAFNSEDHHLRAFC